MYLWSKVNENKRVQLFRKFFAKKIFGNLCQNQELKGLYKKSSHRLLIPQKLPLLDFKKSINDDEVVLVELPCN